MTPLVSILIPAYNAELWIGDTIKSALDQSWPGKEIIIVDDGSKDQTLAAARRFAAKGVSVVTQENQGAAAARNKAFSLAQGQYIQWLDADDLLAPDKIGRQMQALNGCSSKRTLCSAAWGAFHYRIQRANFRPSPLWADLSPVEWLLRKMGQNCHMQTATWLVSRELTEAAGPWDTRLLGDDDGEYFCRVLKASDGVRFVPEAKVYYRNVGSNRLSYIDQSDKKLEAQFVSMQLHIHYLRSLEDSERSRSACVKYLQKYMFDFHPERPDIVRQMQELAATLGGSLTHPIAPWKYYWIQKTFGWSVAKRLQFALPGARHSVVRSWDKLMHGIEHGHSRRVKE
jgi:glycosyltransferase involved in cell wall biosynthesis